MLMPTQFRKSKEQLEKEQIKKEPRKVSFTSDVKMGTDDFRKSGTTRIIDPDPEDEDVSNLRTIQDHLKLERLHQVSASRSLSVVSIATDKF